MWSNDVFRVIDAYTLRVDPFVWSIHLYDRSIYMIDPFIWSFITSIHLYDRSIYMIDPFIWSNLTKYHHFSKHLVHKLFLLTIYDDLWQFLRIWRKTNKKTSLRGVVHSHVRVVEQKDKIWLFQKSRDFDLTYGANWSHIQLDITWLSHFIKMTQKLKNPIFH